MVSSEHCSQTQLMASFVCLQSQSIMSGITKLVDAHDKERFILLQFCLCNFMLQTPCSKYLLFFFSNILSYQYVKLYMEILKQTAHNRLLQESDYIWRIVCFLYVMCILPLLKLIRLYNTCVMCYTL